MKALSILTLPSVLLLVPTAFAQSNVHDRHVVFETSATGDSYFHSQGWVIAPSELEFVRDKFPVENSRFVSPPNCLRLKWKSAPGGDWRMELHLPLRIGPERELDGDTLCLWCYADEELTENDSPNVTVQDSRGKTLPELPLAPSAGVCVLTPGGAGPTLEVVPGEALEVELSRAVANGADALEPTVAEAVRALSRCGGWRLDPGEDPHAVLPLIETMFEAMDAD